ncbi:putative ThiF domain protein [Protomyces lactucae-debilis]|uniref:Putative ThiF domain protein n=1 Tax=Protomyces lactucae-debilis TaxID=2754530 RepID=A0A1Y2FH29_PROLT|nr:putative ThiF domain protein [Protomyces lactucae-debilis]ORY83258.1 putative ThiF domain protein [Protomyces lactucae-debilis]
MDALLSNLASFYRSDAGKMTLVAAVAATATATSIYSYQAVSHRYAQASFRDEAKHHAAENHDSLQLASFGGELHNTKKPIVVSDEIISEQLSRNNLFFGAEGLAKIRNSFVIVVGAGGVGSWAVTMLVRSGVGKIRIIDFDQVTLSSLNRHAAATHDDVGSPKVIALQRFLARVAPWVEIDVRNDLFCKEDAASLLEPWQGTGQRPDYVIDAIDNIETKADLLAYCHQNDLKVMASMGASCKADPTRILIADIADTNEDPLSRATRRHLRQRGIYSGIDTVYSTEKAGFGKAALQPLDPEAFAQGHAQELGILPDFRARILPVMGTMPALFGLTLATHILTTLAEYPTDPVPAKSRQSVYERACLDVTHQLQRTQPDARSPLTPADAGFMIDEAAKGRSALPPFHTKNLKLTRWDPIEPLTHLNVVVVTKEELKKHEENVLRARKQPEEVYTEDELKAVAKFQQYREALDMWRN